VLAWRNVFHSSKSSAFRVIQLLVTAPLLFPLSIAGCLPLYHALQEGKLERAQANVSRTAGEARQSVSAGRDGSDTSFHFCWVCAFTKGMNGGLVASLRELAPPSLASSVLPTSVDSAPFRNAFHPVSRGPPATSPV